MMETDEKILAMRNELREKIIYPEKNIDKKTLEKELTSSIYDDKVNVFGKTKIFEDKVLFNNLISLRVPSDFNYLDEEIIQRIYPTGNPPQIVLSDETDYFFSVGLSYLDYNLPEIGLKKYVQNIWTALDRLGPKTGFIKLEMIKSKDNTPIAVLEFTSLAIDTAVYNIQFHASIQGKVLMGTINFPFSRKERLVPLVREIIISLKNLTKKEEII